MKVLEPELLEAVSVAAAGEREEEEDEEEEEEVSVFSAVPAVAVVGADLSAVCPAALSDEDVDVVV